jgi:N-acetylmuramic acid 6-phosphate etherase
MPKKRIRSENIRALATEQRNRRAGDLDTLSALEIARVINTEDTKVAAAVKKALPQIARAIDCIANALDADGRLIYVGAGTSGRIAALDASEVPPTFNSDPRLVQYVMAGGAKALGAATEADEDSESQGVADLKAKRITRRDVVVGIAASGRTPYTVAAVRYARKLGAATAAVVCSPRSPLGKAAEIEILAQVGPEVVSGSTRMKAGTAQKMILNMLTTGAMARRGRVYGNLMVNVHLKNRKLRERGLGIVQEVTGASRKSAEEALAASGDNVPVALLTLLAGVPPKAGKRALDKSRGHLRKALQELQKAGSNRRVTRPKR